jgi:hypothetical protein
MFILIFKRNQNSRQYFSQNIFIKYIQDVTGDNGQTKKRNSETKFNYSALVAGSRIELASNV